MPTCPAGQACCGAPFPGESLPPLHRRRPQPAGAGTEPGDGRPHQHPAAEPAEGRDRHHRGEGSRRSGRQSHPSHLRRQGGVGALSLGFSITNVFPEWLSSSLD